MAAGATRAPIHVRGRSSVWLEHSTVTREVAGSSPVGPVGNTVGRYVSRSVGQAVRTYGPTHLQTYRSSQFSALVVKLVDTPS